jgi:hypothetical protein
MTTLKVIALFLAPATAMWAGVGFAVWDWHPGNWSADTRAWSAYIALSIGTLLVISGKGLE